MNVLFVWILIYIAIYRASAKIIVKKVVVRTPNPNDIGLVFDLTVTNAPVKEREPLEFRIRSAGTCCVNLTDHSTVKNIGRLVGGNFGQLESGASEVVSLIWPTISVYNRVGSCPIIVTSKNFEGVEDRQKLSLNFDTRFTTLDPEGRTLRKRPEYTNCKNWDMEYLKNCTPVNCEERYFGQRSFYNKTTKLCDEVPRCDKPNMIYDIFNNDCLEPDKFFTAEDMKKIKSGDFIDEHDYEEKAQAPKENNDFDANIPNNKKKGKKKPQLTPKQQQKKLHADAKRAADAFDEEFNKYCMRSQLVEPDGDGSGDTKPTATPTKTENAYMPYWLNGILEGLVVVFATLAIYFLICFVIFLIVTWISRRQFKSNTSTTCVWRSPAASDIAEEPLITPSSLLSQR